MPKKILWMVLAAGLLALCGFGVVQFTVRHPVATAIVVAVVFGVPALLVRRGRVAAQRLQARFAAGGDVGIAARVARGDGLGADELARRLGVSAADLRSAAPTYREVRIPKRRGGERRLHVPDAPTKALQRQVLRRVLGALRAHPAATGFERGKSIVDNARPHVGRAVVIRMDVIDFFPATSAERVVRYFQWIGWDAEAAALLGKLTTWEGGLPQGAPTSPRLSNLVNRYLDVQIANYVAGVGGAYTRYADDITVSLDTDRGRRVRDAIQHVRRYLRHYGYRLHTRRKLHVARRHQRQAVTGLVVNGTQAPPPKAKRRTQRRPPPTVPVAGPTDATAAASTTERAVPPAVPRLPRETRRRIRAMCHRIERGLEPHHGIEHAAGWIAYARMVKLQAEAPSEPFASPADD